MSVALGIILDANLLVLLVVGRTSPKLIATHKRTRTYTDLDFDLLEDLLRAYPNVLVTPNTLTEASNLLEGTPEPAKAAVLHTFKALVNETIETFITSNEVVAEPEFMILGLSDAVQLKLAVQPVELLTADLDLWAAARKRGLIAHNFNHLREEHGTV